jgi:hypothetical protein
VSRTDFFEDRLVLSVVDKATQETIDVVNSRLTRNYGYCFVASIFARGQNRHEAAVT